MVPISGGEVPRDSALAAIAERCPPGTVPLMTAEMHSTPTTFTTLLDCEDFLSYVLDGTHRAVFLDAAGCPWYVRRDVYQDCYAGPLSYCGNDEVFLTPERLLERFAPGRILYYGSET